MSLIGHLVNAVNGNSLKSVINKEYDSAVVKQIEKRGFVDN